jgi:hypothetical protein
LRDRKSRSLQVSSGVCVTQSLVLWVMFCKSLFGLLSFFFWPLCCLSFDLRILITPLVSSNSSIYETGDSSSHNEKHLFPFSVCLNVRVVPSLCSFVLFYSVFVYCIFFYSFIFIFGSLFSRKLFRIRVHLSRRFDIRDISLI